MESLKKICIVIGTRPEAIKMAPVIMKLREAPWANVNVLSTGQHELLLNRALGDFNINVQHHLNVIRENHRLTNLAAQILSRLDSYFENNKPDFVLAQGDTTTVFAVAVACFYNRIPFGHVEAGLRTFDLTYPFPEEFNRTVTTCATTIHFAPTEQARRNLLNERVPEDRIAVTGNTVIDALLHVISCKPPIPFQIKEDAPVILLTAHRRENFGEPLRSIFKAIKELTRRFPELEIVYPVHPNPNVATLAYEYFSNERRVRLCPPLPYPDLVAVMQRSALVLTDSGGLQEEAPVLGKPVLVLRNETERPEAIALGVAKLIGTDERNIVREVERLLVDKSAYLEMAKGISPYGDGYAALRIRETLRRELHR